VEESENREGNHEDDPALGFVEQAFREFGFEVGNDAGESDATGVGDDGDRDGGKEQSDANPDAGFGEIAVNEGKKGEGEQGSNAAAGFDDVEFLFGKFENVAFAYDRDSDVGDDGFGYPAGNQLEREGDLVIDDGGNRHHKEQQKQRKRKDFKILRAAEKQDGTDNRKYNCRAGEEEFRAESGDVELEAGPDDNCEAPPVGDGRFIGNAVAKLPGDVAGDRGNEKTMAHVRIVVPLHDERPEDGRVTDEKQRGNPGYGDPGKGVSGRRRPDSGRGHEVLWIHDTTGTHDFCSKTNVYTENVSRPDFLFPTGGFLMALAILPALPMVSQAALSVMPLVEVRAGMRGVGKTIFTGNKIEDFQVEILGVLQNTGPKESLILGRLSGGPLEHTGVMQGMSGSPVYVDGRLIGAVAMAFPFAKDPIAGIRPIEEMLRVDGMAGRPAPARMVAAKGAKDLTPVFPGRTAAAFGDIALAEVATPLSLSGFSASAVEQFSAGLKSLGLEPRQGISLGGNPDMRMGDPAKLQPGSMISVELMTGDMSVGADGTLTCIDGDKVYAFGHRFLAVGPTDLPFTRSEVITLLANVNTSFKISSAKELMGAITQDRNSAVAGRLGRRSAMVPLDISVRQEIGDPLKSGEPPGQVGDYHMQMVNDRFLSPYLMQMAVFSAIDATERSTGATSVLVRTAIEFEDRKDVLELRNIYTGEGSSALVAATNTAVPLSYAMQAGFDSLRVKRVTVKLETSNAKRDLSIGQVYLSKKEAKPGDTVEVLTVLEGQNGVERTNSVKYTIPQGTAAGTLYFTVADGGQTSLTDLRQILAETPRSPDQLIANIRKLHSSDTAWVRVWRAEPAWQVRGEEIPDPPPSLALVLGATQNAQQNRNSKIAEIPIDAGEMMVTGSKTVQIEVKE
jgi:hypothetical protein